MRTTKPQRLGVLQRTVEHAQKFYFVPSVLVGFHFDRPDVPVHEAALWRAVSEAIGPSGGFDEAMRKEHGEVLVVGSAAAVRGVPTAGCEVRLTFGGDAPIIDKRLNVVGERRWDASGAMTEPEPFVTMPLGWDRAFGGETSPDNPLGRGLDAEGPLPNVEDPRRMVRRPGDRPPPIGLGPRDARASARQKWAGTYDRAWLETHYPGFPADFDFRFFNQAPEDQWLERDFEGGEAFAVTGMHPDGRREGRCPRLRPRAFIWREGVEAPEEVPLRFDTLWLLPNAELGVAAYRGLTRVREDDAADVTHLLLAAEAPGQPRAVAHYADVFARRTQGDLRGLEAMKDDELLPPLPPGVDPMGLDEAAGPLVDVLAEENLLAMNQSRRAAPTPEQSIALTEMGALPPGGPAAASSAPTPDEIEAQVKRAREETEKARAEGERQQRELEQRLRAEVTAGGGDYDAMMLEIRRRHAGPPEFDPQAQLDHLRAMKQLSDHAGVPLPEVDAQLDDPHLPERLEAMREKLLAAYRSNAHYMLAAVPMEGTDAARVRAEVLRARDAGTSLAHRDLTGADLAGLDLSGSDLTGAFLEAANLRGARLDGCRLVGAVLARANLEEARLEGVDAAEANFGRARLRRTDFRGADLRRAHFSEADLVDVRLEEAMIEGSFWMATKVQGGRFRGVRASGLVAMHLDWSGVDLREAVLDDVVLIESTLRGANLGRASLKQACFVTVDATDANFDEVQGESFRVVHESTLDGASFRRARLVRATFRGASLRAVRFDEADLSSADVSEARLDAARLERVVAPKLMAVRTHFEEASLYGADLREAVLQKAYLQGTDLSRSHLFRADLFRIHTSRTTSVREAHMDQMRFKERPDDA